MNYRELRRMYELEGPSQTLNRLGECFQQRHLRPEDFSVRTLAEALIPDGREWVLNLDPRRKASVALLESEAVDVSAFRNITGQLLHSKIMEGYQQEVFAASRLVETIPTRLDGEKIPGVESLADIAETVDPGMPFPHVGFSEDYVETPQTDKRGLICSVTQEAIYFDRTGLIYRQAFQVGEVLGLNKEKRILDCLLGVTNPYNWKGTQYDTYQDTSPWVNTLDENALADWTNVDASEQLFAEMIDPASGEPVLAMPNTLLVMPAKSNVARNIVHAVEVRMGDGSSGSTQTLATSPLTSYQIVSSRLAYHRLVESGVNADLAKGYWYHGDFRRAFAYMENWPITITQAPPQHHDAFERDIVLQVKASERGAIAVLDPRYVVRNTPGS
ncbi:Hypothetical protein PBC10988_27630 [Planctomycetales bacterium 10988]|nr:Hypothetical protein PBC10988_27630 [Planctomycetales bacterium 10988]